MGKSRAVARERVIDSAVRLFSEAGKENVSLNDIARASGVDKATVARNFGDKDGVCKAVAARFAAIRLDATRLDACLKGGAGYEEGLFLLLEQCHGIFFEHIHPLRLCFMEGDASEAEWPRLPFVNEMRDYLKTYIRMNDVKARDDALDMACGMLIGFVLKSVYRANGVGGHWLCTETLRGEFAEILRPQLDTCLMTLLTE